MEVKGRKRGPTTGALIIKGVAREQAEKLKLGGEVTGGTPEQIEAVAVTYPEEEGNIPSVSGQRRVCRKTGGEDGWGGGSVRGPSLVLESFPVAIRMTSTDSPGNRGQKDEVGQDQ